MSMNVNDLHDFASMIRIPLLYHNVPKMQWHLLIKSMVIGSIWKRICALFLKYLRFFRIIYREWLLKFLVAYDKIENGRIRLRSQKLLALDPGVTR